MGQNSAGRRKRRHDIAFQPADTSPNRSEWHTRYLPTRKPRTGSPPERPTLRHTRPVLRRTGPGWPTTPPLPRGPLTRERSKSAAFLHLLPQQQPQFPRPIGQRQAQPLEVRMACPNLCFDGRDLLAATIDSRGLLTTLRCHVLEGSPVTVEHWLLARICQKPLANNVGVPRIDFHEPCLAAAPLASDQS
jgi:hypothetical protein